jgi:hypothetical protein
LVGEVSEEESLFLLPFKRYFIYPRPLREKTVQVAVPATNPKGPELTFPEELCK